MYLGKTHKKKRPHVCSPPSTFHFLLHYGKKKEREKTQTQLSLNCGGDNSITMHTGPLARPNARIELSFYF